MNKDQIKQLLEAVQSGQVDVDSALEKFRSLPYDDLGFAKIDTHRAVRRGFPEVIFCSGKTDKQIIRLILSAKELIL